MYQRLPPQLHQLPNPYSSALVPDTGGLRHGGDAAPPQCLRFRRRPQPLQHATVMTAVAMCSTSSVCVTALCAKAYVVS
jgi:hypothetical protein